MDLKYPDQKIMTFSKFYKVRLLDLIFEVGPNYKVRTKLPGFTVFYVNCLTVPAVKLNIFFSLPGSKMRLCIGSHGSILDNRDDTYFCYRFYPCGSLSFDGHHDSIGYGKSVHECKLTSRYCKGQRFESQLWQIFFSIQFLCFHLI